MPGLPVAGGDRLLPVAALLSENHSKVIKNHLSRLLGERRWTQARLARETGIRPSTISAYYNELAERISYEHMDRICEALDCDVSDLLERVPSRQRKTGKDLILEQHGNRKTKQ